MSAPDSVSTTATVVPGGDVVDGTLLTALQFLILLLGITFAIFYIRSLRKFKREFTDLQLRIENYENQTIESGDVPTSPGRSYALASRGPTIARDAEFESADARWRHLSMAFPHLNAVPFSTNQRDLIIVSRKYTEIDQVQRMQDLVCSRLTGLMDDQGRIAQPSWIKALGSEFDALRHPQLAIANPAIYTFPFFLTWQRRHLWGVLPYATHSRLGVLVRDCHPRLQDLKQLEAVYSKALETSIQSGLLIWSNDPRYADWLTWLLRATELPTGGFQPFTLVEQKTPITWSLHEKPTVFSVGAYLHKEILPLTCAAIADPRTSTAYASFAQELEIGQLEELLTEGEKSWPAASAVIVDLAVAPKDVTDRGWTLLRLPHCVYLPIGIGFSVASVPLLRDKEFRNRLLSDAGETLRSAKDELAVLGIDLDPILWKQI
ncbi:hypothetical protein GE253_24770 [Niveispirillum sp. SYP-B3756]|uniref:hypothetical protein n=1 Tax=Niveispirillum sp. SYP-B3756 TaxID=2662178 RepID=UPI0012917CA4|nr:hypothetical protein [Niveispirillum sp. SYP-B3756]MQP68537.1 hypothetical protein [Niveispirillum sp. SYP-B3756]